ncbi:MAG: hypothetical protein J3K34DRAFT_419761 [Monoraphidium minutum]|nr:MAG: hypothetical protein J3K34DRAFT_419761 [Monoraphidium minutum]
MFKDIGTATEVALELNILQIATRAKGQTRRQGSPEGPKMALSMCSAAATASGSRRAAARPLGASASPLARAARESARAAARPRPCARAAAGTGKTVSGRSPDVAQQQDGAQQQREQEERARLEQQREQQRRKQNSGAADWDGLLSRMAPQRAGDAADVTLMLLSTAALVALSMQVYRAYLLASMYAAESF